MKTSRILRALTVFLLLAADVARATPADSIQTTTRRFNSELLKTLKADPAMSYGAGRPALSIWEQIKEFMARLLEGFIAFASGASGLRFLIGAIAVVILTYVILRLFNIDALGFFRGHQKNASLPIAPVEDIRRMDFETLVRAALQNGDYRQATRLRFLHALRLLSDGQYLTWHPGKTNYEYIEELRTSGMLPLFAKLSRYFEYTWYGHFNIGSQDYTEVDQVFNELKQATL